MEGGQLVKPSTPYIDCFLDIVAKKGFVIDTALAAEFKEYVEGDDDEKQRAPCGTICFHCCVEKDSNKITSFIQSRMRTKNSGCCHRSGHEKMFYISAAGKSSMCGTTETLSASDHILTDTCGICIGRKIQSFEAFVKTYSDSERVNYNDTLNLMTANGSDTQPISIYQSNIKLQRNDRGIVLTYLQQKKMNQIQKFLKYEQFIAQIYHTNRVLYIYNMAVLISHHRIVWTPLQDQTKLLQSIDGNRESIRKHTHELCALMEQPTADFNALLSETSDRSNTIRSTQLFEPTPVTETRRKIVMDLLKQYNNKYTEDLIKHQEQVIFTTFSSYRQCYTHLLSMFTLSLKCSALFSNKNTTDLLHVITHRNQLTLQLVKEITVDPITYYSTLESMNMTCYYPLFWLLHDELVHALDDSLKNKGSNGLSLEHFCRILITQSRKIHIGPFLNAPLDKIYLICERFSAILNDRIIVKLRINGISSLVMNSANYIETLRTNTRKVIAEEQVT
eukprot:792117_1